MDITPKAADGFSFGALYVLIAAIVFWAGFSHINRGFEIRFFKDFLVQWEVGCHAFTARQGVWPKFSGSNHVDYMDRLAGNMKSTGLVLPNSNTTKAYLYRMERFGFKDEDIFVLCLHNRIMLYGISGKTLGQLDKVVDRHTDLMRGRVSGRPGKNSNTYIGMWQL